MNQVDYDRFSHMLWSLTFKSTWQFPALAFHLMSEDSFKWVMSAYCLLSSNSYIKSYNIFLIFPISCLIFSWELGQHEFPGKKNARKQNANMRDMKIEKIEIPGLMVGADHRCY